MKLKSFFSTATVFLVLLNALTLNTYADQLFCHSREDAPTYRNSKGKWTLRAEILSDYRLKDIKLTNKKFPKLGSISNVSFYDKRNFEIRTFQVKPDVFCNYEIQIPRDFSKSKEFAGNLLQTCDDMFDALAGLKCITKKD